MSSSAEPLNLLSYASRSKHNRWGPFLFKLSRRSVVFLLLTAGVVGWLAFRRAPWHSIGEIRRGYLLSGKSPAFMPRCDGMLVDIPSEGLYSIDLATAKRITHIAKGEKKRGQYVPVEEGQRVFAFRQGDGTIRLYDTVSGALVTEFSSPVTASDADFYFSPDGTRLITAEVDRVAFARESATGTSVAYQPSIYQIWDISGASLSSPPKRIGGFDGPAVLQFSGDGTRIIFCNQHGLTFLDSHDLRCVFSDAKLQTLFQTLGEHYITALTPTGTMEVRSAETGVVVDSVVGVNWGAWSPNLHYFVIPNSNGIATDIFERHPRRLICSIDVSDRDIEYFPMSGRLLAFSESMYAIELHDLTHDAPVAIFPLESGVARLCASPDEQTLIMEMYDRYRLFRRAGWDCPESPIGVFAFPHFWLLLVLLVASTLSLLADSRRQAAASGVYQPHPNLLVGLCAVGLVLSFHFIVEACLNNWIRTPALLLLIASIGLAGGSRIWRLITLTLLCGVLAWCCFYFPKVRSMSSDVYQIFDRVHHIPQQLRLVILILAIIGCLVAIVLLSVRQREEPL